MIRLFQFYIHGILADHFELARVQIWSSVNMEQKKRSTNMNIMKMSMNIAMEMRQIQFRSSPIYSYCQLFPICSTISMYLLTGLRKPDKVW